MNTKVTHSVAQAIEYVAMQWKRATCGVKSSGTIIGIAWVVAIALQQVSVATMPVFAAELNVLSIFEMVQEGQGGQALRIVAQESLDSGGWEPAPGDVVVFDPNLVVTTRAATIAVDTVPGECAMQKPSMQTAACSRDFTVSQNVIRFGRTAFANQDDAGNLLPRAEADDLLSTYIEEMAHSWQEYLFETEGHGNGERTRPTMWEDGAYWSHGWEYQAKMYVLNLDGNVLHLSDAERNLLRGSICKDDGYANPMGNHVAAYAAPPGWPNPDGWPTTGPTPEQFQVFCQGA